MPERISRIAELSGKLSLQVLRDGKHCHGSDEALVFGGVERLQPIVLDIGDRDIETICDSVRQIVEDLIASVLSRHKWVI